MNEKRNILLLTNIYPSEHNGGTAVCHYFARDWVKLGYHVVAIHVHPVFPLPFYWGAKLFRGYIEARTGAVVDTIRERKTVAFTKDGVDIFRMQVRKPYPHAGHSKRAIAKLKREIVSTLERLDFVPDYVCGHFPHPQLELLPFFKKKYNTRTCYIAHYGRESSSINLYYKDTFEKELMPHIDVWGFRSEPIRKTFEEDYGKVKNCFICYSGIPDRYIASEKKNFEGRVRRFCYLGSLFELKRVDVTLRALAQAFPNKDFSFDIIGEGSEKEKLVKLSQSLGIENCVRFHGQQPREEAQQIVGQCECFIMVSYREAFGLVYLEAMGKGLITIGTEGQGIDGVIRSGENGYLCPSNNVEKLAALISQVSAMDAESLDKMSCAAIQTAKGLTDMKAAKLYIEAVSKS